MLRGLDKKRYQQRYMKRRRCKAKLESTIVRPISSKPLDPDRLISTYEVDADGNLIPDV